MTANKLFKILSILLSFPGLLALAYGSNPSQDYSISTFSVREGLSQSTVFAIFQDSEGFIWIGTRGGGLNRFDGYNFEVFMHSSIDSSSLSNNEVISIFEDSNKSLWIGTRYGGLNRFDRDKRNFIRYKLDSLQAVAVNFIFEDENKDLFLGTPKGLYFKANDNTEFQKIIPDFDVSIDIISIAAIDENTLVLGARSGIYKHTKNTREFVRLVEIFPDPLMEGGNNNIPVLIDKKGNIWFGTPSGLYVFADSELKKAIKNPFGIDLLDDVHIRTLHEDKKGDVWIGLPVGLMRLNPASGDHLLLRQRANEPNSLSHKSIYSFIEDKDGNFWVGTWGGGITFLGSLPRKFKHFFHSSDSNSISDNIVSSFAEAEDGMWIGTEGGGVNFFHYSTGSFTTFQDKANINLYSNHIKTLYTDSKGMLWIGTWGQGAYRYNPYTKSYKHILLNAKVYTFCEFPRGQMWVGTINGLFRVDYKDDEITHYLRDDNSAGLQDFFITSVFNDSRGNIWVGTQNGGLHLYNKLKDEFINFSTQPGKPNSIIDNYIICITEGPDGDLWIGTNSGICRYDIGNGIFSDMTGQINLPNMVINGLVLDSNSDLWISTNKGLTKYNIKTGLSKNYDVRDGLQSNEFNRGAFFRNSSNDIFFGGINGFNFFNPDEFQNNQSPPNVMITDFRLFNKLIMPGDETKILEKRISETEEITLNYKQSVFTLEFVALNYIATDKNRYKYKLEGYSNEWIDIGHQRSVSFMNLRDGKYTFTVIASNNDNVWDETGASVNITILPPPWRTNLAFLGYLIFISAMVFFFHRLISWRLKLRNRILNEKREKERIVELEQMKLRFFTNITHEFKTPLTLITAPLDNLISEGISKEKKDYYYKLIKGNITRLKSLGNQLIDFRKAEQDYYKACIKAGSLKDFIYRVSENFVDLAEHKNINFKVEIPDLDDATQWFDAEILEKVIFNLLSNAFKFTPEGGNVSVSMNLTKKLATIVVTDNGIGIVQDELPFVFDRFFKSKEPAKSHFSGTGIGLSFAKRISEVHHGTIDVKSEPGRFTEFSLTIPVNKESYSNDEISNKPYYNDTPKLDEPVYIEPVVSDVLHEYDDENENLKIMLVVEDNEEIAQYLINQFSDDFKVYMAANGHDGYEMAREFIPDLIISDIMMDKMSGLEFCVKVKNDIITTHIPFILLTVLVSSENKIEGLEVGADAYVEKPFEIKYLRTLVNNLLKQRAAMKEKYLLENIYSAGNTQDTPDSRFLEKAEEILTNHISDSDFSIITLSEKLNVSRSQLFRKFKSVTGKSPSDFIRIVRLKKAAEIILKGGMGVNEVAYEVGFSSPSHFISCFKKYFGKTPKEYAMSKQ